MLSETIGAYIKSHRLQFHNVNINGQVITHLGNIHGFRAGVKPGNISVNGIIISGSAYTHIGHVFHGK